MRVDPEINPEEVVVRLPAVFGVQPTTYLPILYGALLAAVLFLLLVLPGLVNGGTRYHFTSVPEHAAVRVDGTYVGSTPGSYFVASGEREIQIERPGFAADLQPTTVRRRLLGSLFFPRRRDYAVKLGSANVGHLVSTAATEFAAWSLVGEGSGQYQFPPIARPLARDLLSVSADDGYQTFFDSAIPQVASETLLNDFIAGAIVAESGGGAASPLALLSVLQKLATVVDDHPRSAIQLAEILSGNRRATARATALYRAAERLGVVGLSRELPAIAPQPTATIASIAFVSIPSGTTTIGGNPLAGRGGDIEVEVDVDRFYLSRSEITVAQFAEFVGEQTRWAPANRDELMKQGLVDDQYLADWDEVVPNGDLPVRFVSVYAAEAFASWLSTKASEFHLIAQLPSEAQWLYAAKLDAPDNGVLAASDVDGPRPAGSAGAGQLGLVDVLGNVWEWTSDWFAPYSRYYGLTATAAETQTPAAHRLVLGGSWASEPATFQLGDRGSSPPHWCSPFLGFRLALTDQ